MSIEKFFYIETIGCQMNVSDSERMAEALHARGYQPSVTPERADLIIVNTCSVRERAQEKVLSSLGRYRLVKLARGTLLGVAGCVAQQEKERLLTRVPYLDFVLGTDSIGKLREVLEQVETGGVPVAETAWVDTEEYVFPASQRTSTDGIPTAFVTIMKGCDNVCAFCIVPQTRGREVSRPAAEVLAEVHRLAGIGIREVTLLGQNVNSYRGGMSFAELLLAVAAVPGIARVRFTTSHPHDLSDELIAAIGSEARIMPHFHLPVQSGSNPVLKRMRRDYTIENYRERMLKLRAARPEIAVTTDIIVGFPGETEEDFEATLAHCDWARYDGIFAFAFSRRPRTVAARLEKEWGVIPKEVKLQRLRRLLDAHAAWSQEAMAALVGHEVELLVEGPSRTNPERFSGRTPQNRVVNFDGAAAVGELVRVQIERSSPKALIGRLCDGSRRAVA